jgi:hypothetical protein
MASSSSDCIMTGDVDTTRTVTNNIVGLLALLLALAAASAASVRSAERERRAASGYGART